MTEDYADYDTKQGVNFAKEVDDMEALKAARMEEQYPDEVDTPLDTPARVRFQKYRGLKSFRTTVWDPKENLPLDYARIWQFENFDRTRKRVLGDSVTGAEAGMYVTVEVSGVPRHTASSLGRGLVLTSLLPHEHRMSVMNFAVRRHLQSGSLPVKSMSRLVFQVGGSPPAPSALRAVLQGWRRGDLLLLSLITYLNIINPRSFFTLSINIVST